MILIIIFIIFLYIMVSVTGRRAKGNYPQVKKRRDLQLI
ncbi:hypothetical protein SAMN05444128_1337 [Pontibacter indicus]|uniref:Uncharacterized protein n=1 Tax=Pontibacter indicus TaxID=1317125 RepID=A0A1R3WZL2_9BACT|nr:hypothetical protein SAMN05444128_1337 [Pontibacter indicus]